VSDTDFAALTEPLVLRFWGEPATKTKTQWRWGNGGSRSYKVDEHVWYDHEGGEGGGAIKLVMREEGLDEASAIGWMEEQGLIEPRHGRRDSPERQEAPLLADDLQEEEQPPANTPEAGNGAFEEVEVAHFDYANRDGEFQYRVIRYQFRRPDGSWVLDQKTGKPKKTFKQKSRDAAGNITWGLNGRAPCLYRWRDIELAIEAGKTVLIVEGEKAVQAAVDLGFEATCNSGGAGKDFHPDMLATFKGANVVILPDNDPQAKKKVREKDEDGNIVERVVPRFHPDGSPVFPGQDHAETIAKQLRKIAASVKVVALPGLPLKGDIVEWIEAGGDASKLDEIITAAPEWRPRPPASRMGALGLHELHQPHLKHEFLVDGFLDRRGVAMMPGSSGSGKTFLVLEVGMCIALGRPFWGMETKPGLVVYQAGEGKEGITKRLDGWMLDRGVEPSSTVPFRVLTKKVNLFVDDKDTDDLIAECRALSEYLDQPMRLLVIDTLNKAITGANENAGQDMTKVLARLERLSETLDCAVLVPMHKGKNGEQRGHTSLTGDVSNVLNVTQLGSKENPLRDSNGRVIRTVALDKNKDGEDGRPIRFVLRQVVLGIDEKKDKPITTCVVDKPNGDEGQLVSEGKLSMHQTIYLSTLKDAIDISGINPPPGVTVPYGKRVVTYADFIARLRNKWPFTAPEHEIEKRNKEFERAVGDAGKRLHAYNYVDRDNASKTIWWTGKTDRPIRRSPAPIDPPGTGIPEDVKREIAETGAPF
jgi:hypothetical protein